MSRPNIFIPTNQQVQASAPKPTPTTIIIIENFFTTITQFLVIALTALLPLSFLPGVINSTSFDRVLLATLLGTGAIISACLAALTRKKITTILPVSVLFLALLALWGFFSAYVKGDVHDSLWGSQVESLTVIFTIVMTVSALLPLVLQSSVKMIVRAFSAVGIVALIAILHTFVRYWFGWSLDFGELVSPSSSLVGGFNDSAIYAGLLVLFGLISLIMLPLRVFAQVLVSVILLLSVAVLLLVNFKLVWVVLLLTSLVTFLYVLLRAVLFQSTVLPRINTFTKVVCGATALIAFVAVMFGTNIATNINQATNTQFIEVRPSLTATVDVVRGVYQDSLWFGVGPNRFDDAWRQFKSDDINETVFWDTDFQAGYSYVSSVFVTYGVVGGVLLVLFHLLFVWFGISRLTVSADKNVFARYITTVSFVGALFLWVTTYFYNPSVTLLILAATLTGLAYASSAMLEVTKQVTIPLIGNRINGFILLGLIIVLGGLSVGVSSALYEKHQSQNHSEVTSNTKNDDLVGLRANEKIATLGLLIASAEPETVTQEILLNTSRDALETAKRAVELDPTNPDHLERLSSLFALLGAIGVDGGYLNAKDQLQKLMDVDPKNPKHYVAEARILLAEGDVAGAQTLLDTALELKSNYTEAAQLQVDVAILNESVAEMIRSVEAKANLEPGNVVRWYQLGLLYAASENNPKAIEVLERAHAFDPAFTATTYALAVQYLTANRPEDALAKLALIEAQAPGNQIVQSLINSIQAGEVVGVPETAPTFEEVTPVVDNESGVSVPSEVSSDLIAPVNVGEQDGQ